MSQWISHIEGKWKMSMLFPAFYCNKPNSRAVVVFLHALASWKKSFVHCDLMRDDRALLGCDLKIKISTHTSLVLENRDVSCSLTTWSFFFSSSAVSLWAQDRKWAAEISFLCCLPGLVPRHNEEFSIMCEPLCVSAATPHWEESVEVVEPLGGGHRPTQLDVWLRGDSETSLQTGWRGSAFRLRCECQVVSFAMEKALIIQLYWHQTSCYQPADKHTRAFSS